MLQDKVMVFVNQVGEIVHGIVNEWQGAPNKNLGDAFLLVWPLQTLDSHDSRTKMADMALLGFVKTVAGSTKVVCWRNTAAIPVCVRGCRILGYENHMFQKMASKSC